MKLTILMFFAGAIFAAGLALGGMTDPEKVLAFLDVTGDWDPTLMFVLFPAVIVYAFGFWGLKPKIAAPMCAPEFASAPPKGITAPLVIGAAIFGVGWGIVGLCPGPALTRLFSPEVALFVVAMWAGMFVGNRAKTAVQSS